MAVILNTFKSSIFIHQNEKPHLYCCFLCFKSVLSMTFQKLVNVSVKLQ